MGDRSCLSSFCAVGHSWNHLSSYTGMTLPAWMTTGDGNGSAGEDGSVGSGLPPPGDNSQYDDAPPPQVVYACTKPCALPMLTMTSGGKG